MTTFATSPHPAVGPDRFVVVTGGPGAGKSALIEQLRLRGFPVRSEAGRAIIKNQVLINGPALPWVNPTLFAETIVTWEIRSYREAERELGQVTFFDRGVPDVVGYLRLLGRPVPPHVDAAARTFRYRRQVFIAPPWPAIYVQDTERRQSFDEARDTYEAMRAAYQEYGYDLVDLPLVPVDERVAFVLAGQAGQR